MLKTSTLKPFDKGDIFLGCSYLTDPNDDHKGEGRILQWFADGLVVGRVVEDGAAVELDDLRYGFPGRPEQGLWGIRVPLGRDGRPSGPASRFNRPLPALASTLLARLVREAWAN